MARKYDESFWAELQQKRAAYKDYDPELVYLKTRRADARGRFTENGFVVLKGSRISLEEPPSTRPTVHAQRAKAMEDGLVVNGVLTQDIHLRSKANAANFVCGGNGEWKLFNGSSLWMDAQPAIDAEAAYCRLTDEQVVAFHEAYDTLLCEVPQNYFTKSSVKTINARLAKLAGEGAPVIDEAVRLALGAKEKASRALGKDCLAARIIDLLGDLIYAFDENEATVYLQISEGFEENAYPVNLFNEKTLDELNEIFGGHDKMVITKKVRAGLNASRLLDAINEGREDEINHKLW